MRNICNIDYTNAACYGSFNSACDCNEVILKIRPLTTQLTNLKVEITGVNGTMHTSSVLTPEDNLIKYTITNSWFNTAGTMKVRLLSSEGNSNYVSFTCIAFTDTDDITCKYSSNKFVISKCSNVPSDLPIATTTRLGGIKVGNNLSITTDGVLSSVGTVGPKGDKGDKGDTGSSGPVGPSGPSGPSGEKGDTGEAATINVGTVTTGVPDSNVEITNSGDEHNAIFNFSIPKGSKGDKGEKGESGSSTGTNKAFYITNNHEAIDDESSVEGYDEITIYKKNDTQTPTRYTYTFSAAEKVSPSALYQVWLYLGNLSTLRTYTVNSVIKVNNTLISDGEFTFRPTTQTELICIPMNVNYLDSELDVNIGDTATYDISIKNDLLVQYTGYLYYGGTKNSMVVRNGGSMSATDVYDMFEDSTLSQSEINSTLKERINNKQDTLTAGSNITINNNVISASGGSSSDITYSTSEVKTNNKWIDGKPIYRKTFNLGSRAASTAGEVTFNHGISNCNILVNGYGNLTLNSGTKKAVPSYTTEVGMNNTQGIFRVATAYSSAYITLEYTKTTD